MKRSRKLEVSLETFLRTGQLDCVSLGATKAYIVANFPDPDGCDAVSDVVFRGNIWTYGNIELHFETDRLFLIYTDYIDELDGGPSLALDLWFLADPQRRTLPAAIDVLRRARLDHTLEHDSDDGNVHVLLRDSKVRMSFTETGHPAGGAATYRLSSLALMV